MPLVSALLSELTGVKDSIPVKAAVLTVWVLLFGASTLRGLKKGIQKLADFNMVLVILLLLAILVVGPTLFILKMTVNSLGLMADNFFRMSLWTDPINQSGFPENWTVFYWAWWIAFSAFVGLFIARISRGRTIRQLVLGTIAWGALGTLTYLSITGAFALHLELNNVLPLSNILQESGLYAVTATIAAHLPFGNLSLVFFIVLVHRLLCNDHGLGGLCRGLRLLEAASRQPGTATADARRLDFRHVPDDHGRYAVRQPFGGAVADRARFTADHSNPDHHERIAGATAERAPPRPLTAASLYRYDGTAASFPLRDCWRTLPRVAPQTP